MWFSKHPKVDQDLSERLAKLERKFTDLELEWINFFDKARRMMGRIAKRAETVEKADAQGQDGDVPEAGAVPEPSWLTKLDPVSRSILERRGQIPKR